MQGGKNACYLEIRPEWLQCFAHSVQQMCLLRKKRKKKKKEGVYSNRIEYFMISLRGEKVLLI